MTSATQPAELHDHREADAAQDDRERDREADERIRRKRDEVVAE